MEQRHESFAIAKTVLLSSFLSLCVIGGVLFILREPLSAYVLSQRGDLQVMRGVTTAPQTVEPLTDMIERSNKAVVSVVVTKDVPIYEEYTERLDPWGFFSIPRLRENGSEEREVGGGSGFIVSSDGLIVTNKHVVEDETARYSVVLTDGSLYDVEMLARDNDFDVAILKIIEPPAEALPFLEFGDSDSLRLGQTVVVIGNALNEFQNSVSVGVVSGLSRSIVASDGRGRSDTLDHVIQTDAAINPGNSGGPLIDVSGKVVGVSVATSRGADNISFALPALLAKQAVDSVEARGEIVRPSIGVRYVTVTPQLQVENNLTRNYGALVVRGQSADEVAVLPGSPADIAGIQAGDIIVSVDGITLRNRDLLSIIRTRRIGQVVEVVLVRDGEEKTLSVTLEKGL